MANYHFRVDAVSRGKGRSVTKLVNYISGQKLHDSYLGQTYYRRRADVLCCEVFMLSNAPPEFHDLQFLCDAIEKAERRYDARTAREFKGSLPNELSNQEHIQIVREYVGDNFTSRGLCAIAAIHEKLNKADPSRNNPHVHLIVPTRTVGPEGFNSKKYREHDQRKYISIWREQWAEVQNRAYERNHLDIRVSHESLKVQGIDRKPTIHLSRIDWQREMKGERTPAGDRKREIEAHNKARTNKQQMTQERILELSR